MTVLQTIQRALTKPMPILIHPLQIHFFLFLRRVPEELSRTGDATPLHLLPHRPGTPTWTPCSLAACTRLKCPTRCFSPRSARTPRFLRSSRSTHLLLIAPSRQEPAISLPAFASIRGSTPIGWMISQPFQNTSRPIPGQMLLV